MPIFFHNEAVIFTLQNKNAKKRWLLGVVSSFDFKVGDINVVFCSDNYLLDINKQYLSHDYYTDIITFNYCKDNTISGDLFISVDRVEENAVKSKTSFLLEINRVIVHGVLHLCGFNDKTPNEKREMRELENKFLTILNN